MTALTAADVDAVGITAGRNSLRKYDDHVTRYFGNDGLVEGHTALYDSGRVRNAAYIWASLSDARVKAGGGKDGVTLDIDAGDRDESSSVTAFLTAEQAKALRDDLNALDLDA